MRSFFDEVGGIAAVRLPRYAWVFLAHLSLKCKPLGSACMYISANPKKRWHDSGNLRGYGHVVFKSSTLAEQALALDGKKMMNRYIKVARPMTPRAYQPTGRIDSHRITRVTLTRLRPQPQPQPRQEQRGETRWLQKRLREKRALRQH